MNIDFSSKGLADDLTRAEKLAREVIAKRVAVIGGTTAMLHLAIALHWITVVQSDTGIRSVTGAIDFIGTVVAFLSARSAVTPSIDPRTNSGEQLVPVTDVYGAVLAVTGEQAKTPIPDPPAAPAPGTGQHPIKPAADPGLPPVTVTPDDGHLGTGGSDVLATLSADPDASLEPAAADMQVDPAIAAQWLPPATPTA